MVILVDYSRDDAFSAAGSQAGHVPDTLHLHVRRPLPPGLVRPVTVVMPHVLAEHPGTAASADDQDPVPQFAAEGPVDALADGFIRGVLGNVAIILRPADLNTSPDAGGDDR